MREPGVRAVLAHIWIAHVLFVRVYRNIRNPQHVTLVLLMTQHSARSFFGVSNAVLREHTHEGQGAAEFSDQHHRGLMSIILSHTV